MDCHLAKLLNSAIEPLAAQVGKGFFEAARRGRQVLDLTHALSLILEKGGDLHGAGSVAQADIRQYYDNLRPLLIFRWLRRNNVDLGTCTSFLRLHCLPHVHLAVGSTDCCISGRSIGVLTGSRSAAAAGRIPLLDVAQRRLHTWEPLSFKASNFTFCLGTFVDNIFATGSDPLSAVAILQDAEVGLLQYWRLTLGVDSKLVLTADGHPDGSIDVADWKAVHAMRCLGHHLSADSSIAIDFRDTSKKVWAAL